MLSGANRSVNRLIQSLFFMHRLKKISINISNSITVLLVASRNLWSGLFESVHNFGLSRDPKRSSSITVIIKQIIRICQNCHRHYSFSTLEVPAKTYVRVITAGCSLRNCNCAKFNILMLAFLLNNLEAAFRSIVVISQPMICLETVWAGTFSGPYLVQIISQVHPILGGVPLYRNEDEDGHLVHWSTGRSLGFRCSLGFRNMHSSACLKLIIGEHSFD